MSTKAKFAAGRNIAIKVPPHQFKATVSFYRDVLGLAVATERASSIAAAGVVRCDDIEPLPAGMQGFWVTSPAAIIHLVCPD